MAGICFVAAKTKAGFVFVEKRPTNSCKGTVLIVDSEISSREVSVDAKESRKEHLSSL
jgi:hypothetical protein